jgi:tetratricopeptide (TPR) repeat protein
MPFPPVCETSGGSFVPAPPEPSSHQPLEGKIVVFTGKLSSLGRKDASALVARLGGTTNEDVNAKTTMLVVGAEGFGAGELSRGRSQKLIRAEELNAQQPAVPIQILTEDQFCRLAGVSSPEAIRRQYYATRDLLARYRSLRDDHMRYLVKCGVIRPVLRTNADTFFAFSDLGVIKQANDDLDQGMSFRSVVRSLTASRAGQLAFDFRIEAAPAKIITLRRPADERASRLPPALSGAPKDPSRAADVAAVARDTRRAEEYFRVGSALDDGDEANVEEAAIAYRKALECDPYLVAALINLANIHYGRDDLAEAQALYERAIGLESDFFEAHFNLGNIYHDLNRFPEAQSCYREALRLNPLYADAHFYLAVTFEKMGMSQEARPHWRSYQQLAPLGEWVELAREFSE